MIKKRKLKSEVRIEFINKVKSGFGSDLIDVSLKPLKDGVDCGYIDVCLVNNQKAVRKMFLSKPKYEREKKTLNLLENYPHSPNIISVDDDNFIIVMEYVGVSIADLHKKVIDRKRYVEQISKAKNIFENDYGIYHNDFRWKNICLMNETIYFIDWSKSSNVNKEKDIYIPLI